MMYYCVGCFRGYLVLLIENKILLIYIILFFMYCVNVWGLSQEFD